MIPFRLIPLAEGEDDLLVLFEAYFDDSGTNAESPAVTCAGYIASRKHWRALKTLNLKINPEALPPLEEM